VVRVGRAARVPVTNPVLAGIGRHALAEVLADEAAFGHPK
jgi:hypothetical protein